MGNYSSGWLSTQNWSSHEVVGLDPAVVPPRIYADWWNLYANVFGLDGEHRHAGCCHFDNYHFILYGEAPMKCNQEASR